MRHIALSVAAAAALVVLPAPAASAQLPPPIGEVHTSHGKFEPYRPGANAITYDEALVPPGATAHTATMPLPDGRTKVLASVSGLVPNRAYGAHLHTKQCGAEPNSSGPHFQQVPDPNQPSTDPRYANPSNEVWLDFTTDSQGNATAVTTGDWKFDGRANSFVIHKEHTKVDPGNAGEAGPRLGCLTADF